MLALQWSLKWQSYNELWRLELDCLFNKYQELLTYARTRFHNFVFLISKIHFLSSSQKRKDRKRSLELTYFHCQITLLLSQKYSIKLLIVFSRTMPFLWIRNNFWKATSHFVTCNFYTSLWNSPTTSKYKKLPLWDNFYNLLDLSHMVVIAAECSLLSVPPLVLDNFSNPLVLVYFFNYCDKLRMSALLKKKKKTRFQLSWLQSSASI